MKTMVTKSLDLGCGLNIRNPFNLDEVYGIDIRERNEPNIRTCDLAIEEIPFPDDYFDAISAFDFIEHVPRIIYAPNRRFPFIELMSEIYRTLKMGGMFLSITPAFPQEAAWRDPTHVNIITEDTYKYFCGGDHDQLARSYGFTGMFNLKTQNWDREWDYHLIWELEAVK